MAFNGDFTIAATTSLGSVLVTDTSTGTDAGLTGRQIFIYKADGELFTPAIDWDINDSTKTLAILDKDYALNIKVEWTSSAPLAAPSTYSAEQIFAYTKFGWNEYSQLTRLQTSQPDSMSDRDYYFYKMQMEVELTGAEIAVSALMEDRYAAQRCIDRSQYLIQKKQLFF
jgi:hypothetical protein